MLKACYSDRYPAQTHSNSMEKLALVAQRLKEKSMAELYDPGRIDPALLRKLHAPRFVDAFLAGKKPLATSQGFNWSPRLREAVLAVQAGMLMGADLALEHGIAANVGQGFHHAVYDYGCAFCTFNGLALVAQEHADKRVFVLDCDQHGGNGTAEFTERLPNLFNFTIYGMRFGTLDYPRSIGHMVSRKDGGFDEYKHLLDEAFGKVLAWKTDLLLYQAGVDCHQHDRFGSAWLDSDMLFERDKLVFEFAAQHRIPILFVLAGGYQDLDALVELHVNTFTAANAVFYPGQLASSVR